MDRRDLLVMEALGSLKMRRPRPHGSCGVHTWGLQTDNLDPLVPSAFKGNMAEPIPPYSNLTAYVSDELVVIKPDVPLSALGAGASEMLTIDLNGKGEIKLSIGSAPQNNMKEETIFALLGVVPLYKGE